jgi:flotillin
MEILILLGVIGFIALVVILALFFRTVVKPNEVHIVQSRNKRKAYGNAKREVEETSKAQNSYYNWPSPLPIIGNVVVKLPISIFDISLNDYEAYDCDKVPFSVDIFAQFVITEPLKAAQKISSFSELKDQLHKVLQGVVRATLSADEVEKIMTGRKDLGDKFLTEANTQVKEYGVEAVYLEFMNIEDAGDTNVISNIQAKKKSAIEKDSRVEVAENKRVAKIKEIEAVRDSEVAGQEAAEAVGKRTAEKDKIVGVEKEKANQEIKTQEKITKEKEMDVKKVEEVKSAEIEKLAKLVEANQQKETETIKAEGHQAAEEKRAKAIKAVGEGEAEARKAMELAPVSAQIELANAIEKMPEYQQYLLGIKKYEVAEIVEGKKAEALKSADVKVISAGGNAENGIKNIYDAFSANGGAQIGAMVEAFAATADGKKILEKLKSAPAKGKGNK